MADLQNSQHPLKVLSSSLVLVLHQTGKILRDPNLRNPRQSGLTQKRVNEYVPFANQQFHDALDEIEVEILQAKAVMERDLSVLRKKRFERERIANGLKAQPSPEDATVGPQLNENGPSKTSPTNNTAQTSAEANEEDTEMVDSALEAGLMGSNNERQPEAQQSKDSDNNNSSDQDNSLGLAVTIPAESTTNAAEPPISPDKKFSEATPPAEVPLDSSAADLDFESMFNDTDLTGGGESMDFGIDFSSDGNLNQGVLNDSAYTSIEMSNADMSNLGATTSEDINTLLPGLENFDNAGTDFSNINIPITSTMPDTSQAAPLSTVGAPAPIAAPPVAADSSLDDLFGSTDFSIEGTGDDGMGADNFDNLEDFDEDWFKTD